MHLHKHFVFQTFVPGFRLFGQTKKANVLVTPDPGDVISASLWPALWGGIPVLCVAGQAQPVILVLSRGQWKHPCEALR